MSRQHHPAEVKAADTGQSSENWQDRLFSKLAELSSIRGNEIIQSHPLYVDLFCDNNLKSSSQDAHGTESKLQAKVTEFLEGNSENQATLILFGESGMGKSTALAHIELLLWNQLDRSKAGVEFQFVPFFFELKMLSTYRKDVNLQSIVLKSLYSILNLRSLMEMKQLKLIPVWLFDGFDEMIPVESLCDDLFDCGLSIVTCQQEYVHNELLGNFEKFMAPRTPQRATGFFEVLKLKPFNLLQIRQYLEQWLNAERQYGFLPRYEAFRYFKVISSLPSLKALCSNPFFLSLLAWQIPQLASKHQEVKRLFEDEEESKVSDTQGQVCDLKLGVCELLAVFTKTFAQYGLHRARTMPDWPQGLESDFLTFCQFFCEEIAFIMFKKEDAAQIVDFDDPDLSALLNSDSRLATCSQFILQSIPMRKSGLKTFSFAHRSFWEYFLACRSMKKPIETLGTRLFSANRSLLQKHCEILSTLPDVQNTFTDIVFDSRIKNPDPSYDMSMVRAASNAISILNFGGLEGLIPFKMSHFHDWKGVRISGANLNCAQIIGCNFESADLSRVSMIATFIRDTSMKGADLRGVITGINGILQHSSPVNDLSVSPNGRLVASTSLDKKVRIWDLATEQCVSTLDFDFTSAQAICFSPDSRTVAFCSFFTKITLFDLASGQCTSTFEGHTEPIYCIAYSPDGRYFASCSGDKTIKIWDTVKVQCIQTLEGHSADVLNVAYSSDGSLLASGSADNSVIIWDVSTGRVLSRMEGHTKPTTIAISMDGKTLVSGSWDSTLKIWDLSTHKCIATLTGHSDAVTGVAFSSNGKIFASCSSDKTVKVWNIDTLECTATFEGHTGNIKSVSFVPNGFGVISCSWDMSIRLWPLPVVQCLPSILNKHTLPIRTISFSPDGSFIASGSDDHTIKIWNSTTGDCLKTLFGHSGEVTSLQFSPDSSTIASASHDKTVKLWNVKKGECTRTFQDLSSGFKCLSFSPDGQFLFFSSLKMIKVWDLLKGQDAGEFDCENGIVSGICICNDSKFLVSASSKTIRIWDIKKSKCVLSLHGHASDILDLSFSGDGRTVASSSSDKTVKLWDVQQQKMVASFEDFNEIPNSVSLSPDGKILATGSADATIKLWDTSSHTCIATLEGHSSKIVTLSFSPDGKTLASGSFDKTIQLWDVMTLRPLFVLGSSFLFLEFCPEGARMDECLRKLIKPWNISHAATIGSSLRLHSNGKYIMSVSFDNSIKMWEQATGNLVKKFEGQSVDMINCFSLSPDSSVIVSGSNGRTIRCWDVVSGEISSTIVTDIGTTELSHSNNGRLLASASVDNCIKLWKIPTKGHQPFAELHGHNNLVTSLCFSPNDKILASGSLDTSIKIWNVKSSNCIGTLQGHSKGINGICFSRDGRILISGSADTSIKFWCTSTFRCITTLEGHSLGITCVALSKDGKTLASGSCDRTIKLWDIQSRSCLKTLNEKSSWIEKLCFTNNGTCLISSSRDKTIIVWDLLTYAPIQAFGSYRKALAATSSDQLLPNITKPEGCCTIS